MGFAVTARILCIRRGLPARRPLYQRKIDFTRKRRTEEWTDAGFACGSVRPPRSRQMLIAPQIMIGGLRYTG